MMANERIGTSKLFITTVIENKLDQDEKYDKAYNTVVSLTRNLTETEVHDTLQRTVADRNNHDEICIGLLVGILCDTHKAPRYYRDLALISHDSLKVVTDTLIHFVTEKYNRLLESARRQILWIVRELVRNTIANVEGIVWGLLRQIAGGDVSPKNLWLAEALLDILKDHRAWLDGFPVIVASVAYTYLRILEDHLGLQYAALRQKEVSFVMGLLKERFLDCLKIGRDLIRLLQNIAKIPEIEAFWKELLHNPTSLAPNFLGIHQLMQTRTSRRYFVARLTPEMEKKVVFLCTDVKFGSQKRYQEWFQRQYLNTPESQTLRCDLIRFIIGCIHPSNEVLCSDIIPRWAVIGWLLSSSTSIVATSNAKLALFYDWLFYNADIDNIMNIEPGILVMYHSLRPHPSLTTSLLDFLCRIIPSFYPHLTDKVRAGVNNSLRQILEKRVVPSLDLLFDNAKMELELRKLVRETFPDFCTSSMTPSTSLEEFPVGVTKLDLIAETGLDFGPTETNNVMVEDEAVFSDEEEDVKPVRTSVKSIETEPVKVDVNNIDMKMCLTPLTTSDMDVFNKHIAMLEMDMRAFLQDYLRESTMQAKSDLIQKICDLIFSDDIDGQEAESLAGALSYLFSKHMDFEGVVLPDDISPESLEEDLNQPLYLLFDNLVTLTEGDHRHDTLSSLVVELHKASPQIGYYLLYFLKANSIRMERQNVESRNHYLQTYKDLSKAAGQKDFSSFILKDLQLCSEYDPRLLCWIVPDFYQTFPKQTVGNADLLQILMQRIDSSQLHDLVCMVLQGSLQMFENNHFANILEKSLTWETHEQLFVWQLARAHEIRVDCCLTVLPKLKFTSHTSNVVDTHGEALSNILMMLRRESPSENLLKHLLLREVRSCDPTVVTILEYWVQRYEDKMAKLLQDLINMKQTPSPTKRKRNQHPKSSSIVSLEQVLSHLDHLRVACDQTKFFALTTMQEALHSAYINSSELQRKKFSDLLALIEEEPIVEIEPRKPKTGRGRKPKTRKKQESETEEESSEDEDIKKPTRKKRKNNHVTSDSD